MSVVVMGYRDDATIERGVRSVVEQQAPEPFEVIVVTSGGDRSASIVREHFPYVRVIDSEERLFPGGARNTGIGAASGEVIAFLAADCLAMPGWVSGRLQQHRRGHQAVASAIVPGPDDGLVGRAEALLLFPARLTGHPGGSANHGQSFGLSYTRELLDELGPFDATLRTGEDSEMLSRLTAHGVVPWFDPSIRTAHPGSASFGEYLRDQVRRGGLRFAWERLRPWGRGLRSIERVAHVTGARLLMSLLLALKNTPHRLYWTTRAAIGGAESYGLLLRCSPIILSGIVANQIGWAMACHRSFDVRQASSTARGSDG